MQEEINKFRLSYSSSQLLLSCPRKYWYYKIGKVPKDADYNDDQKAFNIGKAFHEILEETAHNQENFDKSMLPAIFKKYDVEHSGAMIYAMVLKYYQLHDAIGLRAIACEVELKSETYLGYVDVILADNEGNWWIADMKTAARLDQTILAKLKNDFQLNLYAYHARDLAQNLHLDIDKFQGVRYRVTTKSLLRRSAKETADNFRDRVFNNIVSVDVPVSKDKLAVATSWNRFGNLYSFAEKMYNLKETSVMQNFGYCNSYFKPCEYWSRCHGQQYTACEFEVIDFEKANKVKQFNELF